MPTIDIDRDTARKAAQRELAKAIYPKESPVQRFHDWADELLYRLIQKGSAIPGGWFAITVLLIMLAIAVVIAMQAIRRTMRTGRSGGDHPLFDTTQLSADQHRITAESCAAAGNWASAIRHRMRAIARRLEDVGVINPVAGRTAFELARDAATALPYFAYELYQAAMVFNDVTYGERPGTAAEYRLVANLDDRLRSHSSGSPPGVVQTGALSSWTPVR
ncbi:MAG: DUF4129 domain-containing protein [Mycobacterium sp.]|uniref:DUF4129 domain-containing protein n=1 Tax=Mycobacterium sp. TaxID=1785 RepID=UPI00261FAD0C|nr:DUF4129 domain-containing protein [Mycobacterium sp.]MDI3313493.1 DUF4129 domain-containing protein [Mycobacterium sp.]